MGADIHLFVEKKDENGKWQSLDEWSKEDCDEDDEYCVPDVPYGKELYRDRNYYLFALLADVRNYDDIKPIHAPKGLPDDVSEPVKKRSDYEDGDAHSHSWYTLKELQDYDWENGTICRGIVDLPEYYHWKNTVGEDGSPRAWCGGIGGEKNGQKMVSNFEMDQIIKDLSREDAQFVSDMATNDKMGLSYFIKNVKEGKPSYYTVIKWNQKHKDSLGNFSDAIDKLVEMNKGDNPDNIRIVIWFDN